MEKKELKKKTHYLETIKKFALQLAVGVMTLEEVEKIADLTWQLENLVSEK